MYIHQSVTKKCVEYLAELARHNYVTPKSYLELLNIFSILIGQKKQELKTAKNRMKSGLDKVSWGGACGQRPAARGSAPSTLALLQAASLAFQLAAAVFKRVASFFIRRAKAASPKAGPKQISPQILRGLRPSSGVHWATSGPLKLPATSSY